MADTKNYGLKGVGNDVQLGKAGPRLNLSGSAIQARNAANSAYVNFKVLTPVADEDAATKLYVDNVASGLDPKESCQCATTANLANFTTGGNNGQFTAVPATIDGVTLAEGDRVLVKNQSTPTQNGIYVVTATTTTIQRAADHDGTPAGNVSGGNFTFVEGGTTYANTGWVLSGDGALTVNTDAINWVQFSGAGTYTAGTGLTLTGSTFDLDFSELTSATTIALADELIFQDAAVESRITVSNFLADRDIPNAITTNGLVTRTAADTYTSRSVAASAVAGDEGISVVNGDGVSGNITIGIDIIGQTSLATVETGDEMLISDANASSANKRVTVDALKTFMNAGTSSTSITEGDTTVAVADAGSGTVTTTIDGVVTILSTVSSNRFTIDSATTAADIPVITLRATSSGTPAVGIGPSIEFEAETSAGAPGNIEIGGLIALEATDVTSTSEDFDFVFQLMAAGAAATEAARITSLGGLEAASGTFSSLTSGRVPYATTAGLLTDSANFTFNGTTMGITAAVNVTGDLDVDNINVNGNTISVTDTNGNLILLPNGTGSIIFQNGSAEEILELNDTASAVNGLAITAGATGVPPTITTGTGAEANIDIGFLTNGTGVLSVTAGSGNYEDNVTADDDIPNKKYVDDLVTAQGISGVLDTVTGTVALTSAATVNIGAATGIPDGATIMSVTLDVTVASDAATTVTVGDATNGAASYMAATENDPQTIGIYIADGRLLNSGAARQATATVATPGTVGSATCIITFRRP